MKDFKFRYGEDFGFDKPETECLDEKVLQYEIATNIDVQIGHIYR